MNVAFTGLPRSVLARYDRSSASGRPIPDGPSGQKAFLVAQMEQA